MIEYFGIVHLVSIVFVIAIDIVFNTWYIGKGLTPNHLVLWLLRAIIAIFVVSYGASNNGEWFWRIVNVIPLYWFCFDYGLNKARGKYLTYLGIIESKSLLELVRDDFFRGRISILDQFQLKTLGEYPWFVFKGLLALFSLINMLFSYNPYSSL